MPEQPIHRDDVDADLVADIEAQFAELYPGMKVVFAGDAPGEASLQTQSILALLEQQARKSLVEGSCIDCGAKMPNYDPDREDWQPEKGWGMFTQMGSDEPMGWQCPKCDADEQDGEPRRLEL